MDWQHDKEFWRNAGSGLRGDQNVGWSTVKAGERSQQHHDFSASTTIHEQKGWLLSSMTEGGLLETTV